MKSCWKDHQQLAARVGIALCLAAGALAVAGCGGLNAGGTAVVRSGSSAGVFPPSSQPYGKSYGEWGDAWWQWLLAIPKPENPAADATGEKCGVNQSGPVWFLAGTTGSTVERMCTIPAGKALLFPIVNILSWDTSHQATLAQLRAEVAEFIDHVTALEASVDGVALQGLRDFRFRSPATFFFTGPPPEADPLFGEAQSGMQEAVADGYWVMLEPLSPGPHTLQFRGKYVIPADSPTLQTFENIVTYHLTVQ